VQRSQKIIGEKLNGLLLQLNASLFEQAGSESQSVCALCTESTSGGSAGVVMASAMRASHVKYTLGCSQAHQLCDACFTEYRKKKVIRETSGGAIISACPACPYAKNVMMVKHSL
jgi:hypothetical protein